VFVRADDRPQDNCGHLVLHTAALTVTSVLYMWYTWYKHAINTR